ncbi:MULTISPECIES: VOC family protein [unclassified Chryseobacterium]|uniref:VOC family protein n=1 Tax=unclassified Chryseobacterium TaxID=2593645 RepID=UPI00226A75B8|nr:MULTISPECIES: VOC family protein [unclassified Chryseobacterium]
MFLKSPNSLLLFFCVIFLLSCNKSDQKNIKTNPVVYFEIPVTDLKRAEKFYTHVFNFTFESEIIDHYEMALFPFSNENSGITGALAKGDVYKPTKDGVIIYFKTDNIDEKLTSVVKNGGKVLYPKTINEKHGFAVAEFEDSEGNRIALHESIN